MTLRMPAETDRHEQTVMAWPVRRELWLDQLDAAKHDYAEVARVIARREPVLMVAKPGDGSEAAAACGAGVEVVEIPIDDSWARDSGPIVVTDPATGTGARVALDFEFNAWGEKFVPFADDAAFAARVADRLGIEHRSVALVFEAGAITVDGQGTLVTTEQCLLHPNRNPGMTRDQITEVLRTELGAERVVWLPFGLVEDHDTDGHVDNVAAFVRPGLVALQATHDPAGPDGARLRANMTALRAAGLDAAEIGPLPYARVGGRTVPVPYLNWYVANDVVVVPVTGHDADATVLAQVSALYGREAVGVPGGVIAYGGGGVHCITQQIPAWS